MRVLFLCTHNSSCSQMAEGFLCALGGEHYEVFSAGTQARGVNPLSITVMAERGIDISEAAGHRSKMLQEYLGQPMDLVVTVCDEAAEECPFFAGARCQEHLIPVPPPAPRSSGWLCSGRCATRLRRGCVTGWPRNQLREKPGRSG
jgi:arsenate reductase (thioredoxin)